MHDFFFTRFSLAQILFLYFTHPTPHPTPLRSLMAPCPCIENRTREFRFNITDLEFWMTHAIETFLGLGAQDWVSWKRRVVSCLGFCYKNHLSSALYTSLISVYMSVFVFVVFFFLRRWRGSLDPGLLRRWTTCHGLNPDLAPNFVRFCIVL